MPYTPAKINAVRTFRVFTQPSAADPAWMISCVEVFESGDSTQYFDYSPLKMLIKDCEELQIANNAKMQAFDRIVGMFGCESVPELYALAAKCKAQKEAA